MELTLGEQLIYLTPRPALATAVMVVTLLAFGLGRYGRRRGLRGGHREEFQTDKGFLISSAIGVLALLFGFTFSIAIGHFGVRRSLVVEEANKVMATYDLSYAVASVDPGKVRALLTEFAEATLAGADSDDPREATRLVARRQAVLDRLLAECMAAARAEPGPLSNTLVQGANALAETAARRVGARREHVPFRVYLVLLANLMVVAAGIGFEFSARARYFLGTVLIFLFTVIFVLITDLDRPMDSAIRTSQQAMKEAYTRLQADPLKALAAPAAQARPPAPAAAAADR